MNSKLYLQYLINNIMWANIRDVTEPCTRNRNFRISEFFKIFYRPSVMATISHVVKWRCGRPDGGHAKPKKITVIGSYTYWHIYIHTDKTVQYLFLLTLSTNLFLSVINKNTFVHNFSHLHKKFLDIAIMIMIEFQSPGEP